MSEAASELAQVNDPSAERPAVNEVTLDVRVVGPEPIAPKRDVPAREGQEQALESHEVIELQTFSERKAWIEDKIKFLETLPAIEVFFGLDSVRSSSEDVPGLPTRTELQRWMTEHDIIEKETEIFDTGELTKLRQLTKAATQRNLSPEDTDVIELTLTTIMELDKLLHLLRDRSENLEMLNIRLTWEEHRQAGWKERRQIVEDLHTFAVNRARWSPAIYEHNQRPEDSPDITRRGSITSLASIGSDLSVSSPAFSRSARFRLAELLSRDAAHFTGRVTSLRHGKVMAAGKALDKLIDQSRKPVPEELLDEQDRLEEKCIHEMETIGKFTLSLVMQWRKADEIYVETMKDQTSALNLLEEIETASLYHPTSRQSSSFMSKIDTILKRLAVRGDPAMPATLFPRPEHLLFPDQKASNEALIQSLSSDIATAFKMARKVDSAAKEYRVSYEAVKRVETMVQAMNDLSTTLTAILRKFQIGVPGGDGDNTPPDLTTEDCLEPSRHAVFLALFPSLLEETAGAIKSADEYLRSSSAALLGLHIPGIDQGFKENATSDVQKLASFRDKVLSIRNTVTKRVDRLREARKIVSIVDTSLKFTSNTQIQILEAMEKHRWVQQSGGFGAPPTPQTPVSELVAPAPTCAEFEGQLLLVNSRLKTEVRKPLDTLCRTLESPLQDSLQQKVASLETILESSHQMLRLLTAIKEQSSVMNVVRDNFHNIFVRIEDTKIRIGDAIEGLSRCAPSNSENDILNDFDVDGDLTAIQEEIRLFNESLSTQVPFISRHSPSSSLPISLKLQFPSNGHKTSQSNIFKMPFEPFSLDAVVREDANTYAIRLNGGLENLHKSRAHLESATIAKAVDAAVASVMNDINTVVQGLATQRTLLRSLPLRAEGTVDILRAVLCTLEQSRSPRSKIASSLSPIRELVHRMDTASKGLEPSVREGLYGSRNRAIDDAELRFSAWDREIVSFKEEVSIVLAAELQHQEEIRVVQEQRRLAEEERVAAEEIEQLRREQERIENEERKRLLVEMLAQERQQQAERDRIAAVLAEEQRILREAEESERERHAEESRLAEIAHIEAERERLKKEEASKVRLEQERLDALEKLRTAEACLAEERRQQAERERIAAELVEKQRIAQEIEESNRKRRAEASRLAEVARVHAARERLEKEEADKSLLEQERLEMLNKLRAAEERLAEERRQQVERDRIAAQEEDEQKRFAEERRLAEITRATAERDRMIKEEQEKARIEQERVDTLEMLRVAQARLEEERRLYAESERVASALAEKQHLEVEKLQRQEEQRCLAEREKLDIQRVAKERAGKAGRNSADGSDIFGMQSAPSSSRVPRSQEVIDLEARILTLRKRLRSICIYETLRPTKASTDLPSQDQVKRMTREFREVSAEILTLPASSNWSPLNTELRSLRGEVHDSSLLLKELEKLVDMSEAVQSCDAALSDLLEHIDSYPNIPLGVLSSTHRSLPITQPEDQLSARLAFTRATIDDLATKFSLVTSDHRCISEHTRITQTWSELEEMANDRIGGRKSRPESAASSATRYSSGRNTSASQNPTKAPIRSARKTGSYSHLSVSSVSSPSRGKMLAPPTPTTRRAVSSSNETQSRSTSRLSTVSSNRSVSGPLTGSLYGSTFASRQRTTSLSASNNPIPPTSRRPSLTPSRFRMNSETKRSHSPSMSETSSISRSALAPSHSSINSTSNWSRAPRDSFSSILPRAMTPHKKTVPPVRKKYVADPKSKLDVAVGDVVNQLPVGINIEGITESWHDQSGKYWIGNQDPKLCFCRILRSQTVMVRVGGGWTELSKFIKNHFAESFRLAPESPPRYGVQEEKWISSATLLEAPDIGSPPPPPRTPEPKVPFMPSFSLMTPSGQSPHSLKSSPSAKGSPLTPLQFIRRAEPDHTLLRPVTPSKTPLRSRATNTTTPSRASVWRP
ncbi:hypothetical protein B0H34DRAFT_793453 [Crassisporium funariophilum]|nr:hypothetical protein B0H34DRAFT_793453 [Crassisporium funariophilum]